MKDEVNFTLTNAEALAAKRAMLMLKHRTELRIQRREERGASYMDVYEDQQLVQHLHDAIFEVTHSRHM